MSGFIRLGKVKKQKFLFSLNIDFANQASHLQNLKYIMVNNSIFFNFILLTIILFALF